MNWGKTIRGRRGSQVMLTDNRDHPFYRGFVLSAVGETERSFARVPMTRKGLLRLREACDEALRRGAK